MVQERRQFPRLTPGAALFVSLGESRPGLLLDLCEGGLAVASLEPRSLDEVISLAFDLPEGTGHIQANAEVAWTRDSGHLTGVRFLELAEPSRRQLEEWVISRTKAASSTPAIAMAEPTQEASATSPADPSLSPAPVEEEEGQPQHPQASLLPPQPATETNLNKSGLLGGEAASPEATPRYPIRLFLAVMLLSWALVFLGYRMGSTEVNPDAKDVTAAAKASGPSSTASVASVVPVDQPAPSAPLPKPLPWNDAGVVLQVGAMKQENNADALAEALQKKNFPAFVFQRGPSRLYKVAVGPYSAAEANSTFRVKDDLEKQGFKPILRHWLPE
jgi:hypothetical protein